MNKWRIVPEKTSTHLVTFRTKIREGIVRASTKWDGCTDMWFDEDSEEECYHHICELDELIVSLTALREQARAYFGGEFCVSGITEESMRTKVAALQAEGS